MSRKIGIVSEGVSDFWVLRHIITRYLKDQDLWVLPLNPKQTKDGKQDGPGGWGLVMKYLEDKESGEGRFHIMSMEEYTDLVAEAIALLPETTVIHRMQGDGPRKLLVEPLWSLDKKRVLNMLTAKTGDVLGI